jgi:hypothetical protein
MARLPLREIVPSQDIVYVGGGSMRNLLAIWRVHGLDLLLREAWERGIVLAGLSAGAMCWFQGAVTTSFGAPVATTGLGWLPAPSPCTPTASPTGARSCLRAVADDTVPAEGTAWRRSLCLSARSGTLAGSVSSGPG